MDVSDFFIFSARGGRGEFEAPGRGGGDRFLIENAKRGGFPGGEGPRGREGVCGELGNFLGGGGLNIFSGPKCLPSVNVIQSAKNVLGI